VSSQNVVDILFHHHQISRPVRASPVVYFGVGAKQARNESTWSSGIYSVLIIMKTLVSLGAL
jgi:hypothetical protein